MLAIVDATWLCKFHVSVVYMKISYGAVLNMKCLANECRQKEFEMGGRRVSYTLQHIYIHAQTHINFNPPQEGTTSDWSVQM